MEDAALAGDTLPSAPALSPHPLGGLLIQPHSGTTQHLCGDSSRTTAHFGSRSFQSQLSGGAHLNKLCSGNTEAAHELVSTAPLGYATFATLQQLSYPALSRRLD